MHASDPGILPRVIGPSRGRAKPPRGLPFLELTGALCSPRGVRGGWSGRVARSHNPDVPLAIGRDGVMSPFVRYGLRLAVALALASGGRVDAGGYVFQTIDVPGASATAPQGINDAGQIVGFYRDSGGVGHGFLDVG